MRPPSSFTAGQRRGWRTAIALTLTRLALAPAILALGVTRAPGAWIALLLVVGFISDVLDGVIARRANAVTPALRRVDSAADIAFYLSLALAAWLMHRDVLVAYRWAILAVLGGEIANAALAWLRFRREASYHTVVARGWGALLFASLIVLFWRGEATLVPFALALGIIAEAESLAITMALREWRTDVRGLWSVMRDADR
ncbi:MAG: CDP-alcohol phosphatidyltransferase family protein [Gemmatimonadaceae bacterium]